MADQEPARGDGHRIRNWTIGTAIAALGLVLPVNKAYVQWHEDQARSVVQQELGPLQKSLDQTQETADMALARIDFLVKAEASRLVNDIQTQIAVLKALPDQRSASGRVAELEYRLNRAITYRDCVVAEKANCDALRVW